MFEYNTIQQSATAEFKDRGSKFIAYTKAINNTEDAKTFLKEIKALHPKATHHCYAYRLGLTPDLYRAVDDGEPSGSAGKPILNAIDSLNITNAMAIVVRYYGGTLLGVPGLIHAYKTNALDAINASGIITKEVTQPYELNFDYNLTSTVNQVLVKLQAVHTATENLLFCKKRIFVPKSKELLADELLNKIPNLQVIKLNME